MLHGVEFTDPATGGVWSPLEGGPIVYADDRVMAGWPMPRLGGHGRDDLTGQNNVFSFYDSVASQIAGWFDQVHADTVAATGATDALPPSWFAMAQHDAHWKRYGQGYTEATNIESVRWAIVDAYVNQEALRATRNGRRIDVMAKPEVRQAIADEEGNRIAREQAQSRNPWDPSYWLADAMPWLMVLTVGLAAWLSPATVAAETGTVAAGSTGAEVAGGSAVASGAADGVQLFALQTAPATVTDLATGAVSTFETVTGSALVGAVAPSIVAPAAIGSIAAAGALMPPAPAVDPSAQMIRPSYASAGASGSGVPLPSLSTVSAGMSVAAGLRRLFGGPVAAGGGTASALPQSPALPGSPGAQWWQGVPVPPGVQPSAIDWLRSPGPGGLPWWMLIAGGGALLLLVTGRRGSGDTPTPQPSPAPVVRIVKAK